MPEQKWKYVNIPKAMWKEIQKLIDEQPQLGYKSVADFVASAVRLHKDYWNEGKPEKPQTVLTQTETE